MINWDQLFHLHLLTWFISEMDLLSFLRIGEQLHCLSFWMLEVAIKEIWVPVDLQTFPCGSAVKESACNAGDLGSIPGLGRSPGDGKGYPLQYSGLENFMDYTVCRVTKNQTWLSDFHLHLTFKLDQGIGDSLPPPLPLDSECHFSSVLPEAAPRI